MHLALALLTLAAAAKEAPTTPSKTTPGAAVRAAVSFKAPAGWHAAEYANGGGADPVLEFKSGLDRIALNLYGSKGSAYRAPEQFLRGPAASTLGKPPRRDGAAMVAGRRLAVYRRGSPVMLGDPHAPSAGAPALARERFIVLPLTKGLFVVVSHVYESPVPSAADDGEKAFALLLKSLKPAKP